MGRQLVVGSSSLREKGDSDLVRFHPTTISMKFSGQIPPFSEDRGIKIHYLAGLIPF